MNRYLSSLCILSGMLGMSIPATSQTANAEEAAETAEVPRAVWIAPSAGTAPWLDNRTNSPKQDLPQILATGGEIAIVQLPGNAIAVTDARLNVLGEIRIPENTRWIGIDGHSRILIYDGSHLRLAASYRDAASEAGYRDILSITDSPFVDNGDAAIAYINNNKLHIAEIDSGSTNDVTLTDFFSDLRVERMTPQNVEADAATKASKNKKAIKALQQIEAAAEAEAAESAAQPFEVSGLWMRPDNTVVVRVRRMLNERTFVSIDAGKSWTQLTNTPQTLIRQGNWIWDGGENVLALNAKSFVKIKGTPVFPADRWLMTHTPETGSALPEDWLLKAIPAQPPASEVTGDAGEPIAAEPADVGFIPVWTTSGSHSLNRQNDGIYQPQSPDVGIQMGFYRNATCPGQVETCAPGIRHAPDAWQQKPDGNVEPLKLPESCSPRYLGSDRGLGILVCDATESDVSIYVKTASSEWVNETSMPAEIAQDLQIVSAEDGTIALMGQCHDEVIAPADPETEMPETTARICPIAVRMPKDIGQPDAWRLERVTNASAVSVIEDGRLLAIQSDVPSATFQRMTLLSQTASEPLVDRFDPSPYEGVVLTDEGCLALVDGSADPQTLKKGGDSVKLLSVSGGFAGMDCASSKAVLDAQIAAQAEADKPTGDPRYGLRLGAAGFFASGDVQTWSARVEGLFPIYGGQYEVGLMYRMAGGNKGNAMGHLGILSVRWRYDGLEKFDFAVGAGIGYGSMCGYEKDKKAEENTEEDTTNERKKGYEACNTLSMRYMVSGIATYKFAKQWKLYIATELLGGSEWGIDIGGGIEVRF